MAEQTKLQKIMAEAVPTGAGVKLNPVPLPIKPDTWNAFIDKWVAKSEPHETAAVEYGKQAEALFVRYEQAQWQPDRSEQMDKLMPGWLKRLDDAITSIFVPYTNYERFTQNKETQKIADEATILVDLKAKEEYFFEFYNVAPLMIQTGLASTFDDFIALNPSSDLSRQDIEMLRADFDSMIEGATGEGFSPEDMASISGTPEGETQLDLYPELVAPTNISNRGRPVTLHQLSAKEILKGLTVPTQPETYEDEATWNAFLKSQGYSDIEVDNELIIQAQNLGYAMSENIAMRESLKAGLHQLPDYGIKQFLGEMLVSPGIALLEVASIYFERVSQPLAGKLWSNFFPSLDESINDYMEGNPDASDWEAYSQGFDTWDFALPGEESVWFGTQLSWAVKYMLFEGIADPTTYIGFGLFGRLGKGVSKLSKFGKVGKMLSRSSRAFAAINTLETGALHVLELPFDFGKYLASRVPKTPALRAAIQERTSIKILSRYYTLMSDKTLRSMNMKEFKEISIKLIAYKQANKGLDNDITRAAEQLLLHGPFDEKDVSRLMTAVSSTLGVDDITKATAFSVDDIFENWFTRGVITDDEATGRILTALSADISDANRNAAKKFFKNRSDVIKKKALAPTNADTPRHAIMNLAKTNYAVHIKMEKSSAALARKELGPFATTIFNIPQKVTHIWTDYIDRYFVMPMAQNYLVFAAYGPFNVFEDIFRTFLGGVRPGRAGVETWENFVKGIMSDPDAMRPGISEMLGPRGVNPEHSLVHYLTGFGNKNWGAKLYKYMVDIPGGISMDLRRNFLLRRNMQIVADLGGDAFKKLESIAARKLPKTVSRRVSKQVRELVRMNSIANNPEAIRKAVDKFTRAEIALREYDNLLKEFPGISSTARLGLLQDFSNHITFADVVDVKATKGVRITTKAFGTRTAGEGAGTFYSLSKVTGEAGEEISMDFANVYRVSSSRANQYPDRPVETLAKEWFPERDFISEATDRGITEELAMNRAVGEEASRRGYDAIKYGNKEIQSLKGVVPVNPHDSIDASFQRRLDEIIDRFVKGPEAMTTQAHALTEELIKLEVQKPEEMARAIEGLYHLSTVYGSTPQQMIAEATIRSRGMNLNRRTKMFDEAFDRISKFLDDVGLDIDTLINKIRVTSNTTRTINKVDWSRVTIQQSIKDANLDKIITDTIDGMSLDIKINIKEIRMANPTDLMRSTDARWSQRTRTLILGSPEAANPQSIRHEIGHSILNDNINRCKTSTLLGEFQDAVGVQEIPAIGTSQSFWRITDAHDYSNIKFSDVFDKTGELPRPDNPEVIRMFKRIVKEHDAQLPGRAIKFDKFAVGELKMSDVSYSFYHDLHERFVEDFASYANLDAMSKHALTDAGSTPESMKWFEDAYPKTQRALGLSAAQKRATNNTLDIMTAIKEKAYEFRNLNNQTRHDFFIDVDATTRHSDEFWGSFRDLMSEQVGAFDNDIAELNGRLFKSILDMNYSAGEKRIARPSIIVKDRPLAAQDVAQLLGIRGDDISRGLLDSLTIQNNRSMFIVYIQAMRQTGDVGFTKQAIGQVYDQIVGSMRIKAGRMSWATKEIQELDAARRESHSLYNSKVYSTQQSDDISKYLNDSADMLENMTYDPAKKWKWSREWQSEQITNDINTFAKTRPDDDLWYHGGPTIDGPDIENGYLTKDINEAIDYAMGAPRQGRVYVVSGKSKTIAPMEDITEKTLRQIEDPVRPIKSFSVDKTYKNPAMQKTIKPEFSNWNELRQQAMDEAEKWYAKEFPDYTNANMFDSMMKAIYPYWTYESQRWFWLPRSFIRHPGTFTSFERWQDNTDRGYVHVPGTSVDIGFGRGTVYGTLQTQLAKRDFPEYADSLKAAGGMIEFNDYLSRFGFYPGAHIQVPLSLFGGADPQLGEVLPSTFKTPLSGLVAAFPKSDSIKWLSDHIFSDRFRNYMTILEVNARGGNGSLIWSKIEESRPLTEEEQAIWDASRGEAALYSVGFEQMGIMRFRTDEYYAAAEQATIAIEEVTGVTAEQQLWYRRHNIRLWDTIGGMSISEVEQFKALDMWANAGSITPLLPSRQQEELRQIEIAWDDIGNYVDGITLDKNRYGDEFLAGNMGPDAYVGKMKDLASDQRAYVEQKMIENPNLTLEGRKEYMKRYNQVAPVMHPSRELVNMYFGVELREKYDEETGELIQDWDRFFAERQAIEAAVPEEYRAEWDAFLSKNLSPVELIRQETNEKYVRKYNEVWNFALDRFTDVEQALIKEYLFLENTGAKLDRQAEIKATQSSYEGRLLISAFRASVSAERKALRYANPYLDAWLFYWGKTTTFTSLTGEQVYNRLASETGRSI